MGEGRGDGASAIAPGTIAEALRAATARLAAAGIDSAALDARLLLGHAMQTDQASLLRDRTLPAPAIYAALVARRAGREPLCLITGRQGFWTLDLEVSPATLIPRPDSETLIEAAITPRRTVRTILDLGTGTGCLLLAALAEYPEAWGLGLDLNPEATALAARNARANGLAPRAVFVAGDWAASIAGRFDLILGNPPYIAGPDIPALMPEVARHEPRAALYGGSDGLVAYRAIIAALPSLLEANGLVILELGAGQGPDVSAMAQAAGFRTALRADLGGVDRALLLEN